MIAGKPIKFLLVDDLEANLIALEELLKRDGLQLLKAHSGPEALELLLIHDIALALVDVKMPGMSGFELAEIMRSTARTRSVPIIFLTAGVVDQQHRIRGYETGAVDFLPKPIEPITLYNKSATFYELARQREELRESEARLRDVNDELAQKNVELAKADQSKNEFLAMLAHELRNPLAPLRNSTEILRTEPTVTPESELALNVINRQIENMSRMIDDLLDVSRITEGKIELQRKLVAIQPILQSAIDLVRPASQAAGQTLILSMPEKVIHLDADATRLEQIIGNLLSNACKYSGQGANITLTAEEINEGSPELMIRIADDGIGISSDLLPRIFDLFVQASRTLDRSNGGLGIGLTLVRRLVNLHGGTIEARSEGIGEGSEFIIRLPIPSVAPIETRANSTLPNPKRRSIRMLVVDDNRDSAESMAALQKLRGHDAQVALNGPEALAVVAEFTPEVVILDLGLPGMDGFEVARQIRTMPSMEGAYLVALTGYGSEEDRIRAREVGFDEHLVKPANFRLLSELLEARFADEDAHLA